MATHSSILDWRILWTEDPGGLHSMRLERVRHDWLTKPPHILKCSLSFAAQWSYLGIFKKILCLACTPRQFDFIGLGYDLNSRFFQNFVDHSNVQQRLGITVLSWKHVLPTFLFCWRNNSCYSLCRLRNLLGMKHMPAEERVICREGHFCLREWKCRDKSRILWAWKVMGKS